MMKRNDLNYRMVELFDSIEQLNYQGILGTSPIELKEQK
jgi:hypothetical protein